MKMIKGLLVDPYRKELRHVEVECDIQTWHLLLQCDCCDVRTILHSKEFGTSVDVWFDDEFLCHGDTLGPSFRFVECQCYKGPLALAGYGLLVGSNSEGDSVSLDEKGFRLPCGTLQRLLKIQFENWQNRLDQADYMAQILRTPEIEPGLQGRFRYLDSPVESGKVRC